MIGPLLFLPLFYFNLYVVFVEVPLLAAVSAFLIIVTAMAFWPVILLVAVINSLGRRST